MSLNLNSFPSIPPNFEGNKNLRFWEKMEEWAFLPNHSIPSHLNSQTRGMEPPLKLPNKIREEYSKNIIFILFHSIPFPPPKWSLNATPCISSRNKSCNFLMVCWLMSSHQFWQFKPFQKLIWKKKIHCHLRARYRCI